MCVNVCKHVCEHVCIFAYSEKLSAEIANWSERTNGQTWAVKNSIQIQWKFLLIRKDKERKIGLYINIRLTLKLIGPGDLIVVMSAVFCYAELEIYYYYYYYWIYPILRREILLVPMGVLTPCLRLLDGDNSFLCRHVFNSPLKA
jgi:hypothetical protein